MVTYWKDIIDDNLLEVQTLKVDQNQRSTRGPASSNQSKIPGAGQTVP